MPPRPERRRDGPVPANRGGLTFLSPHFALSVGGRNQPGLAREVKEIEVYEGISGEHRASLLLNNWSAEPNRAGFIHFGREVLDFGKSLEIRVDGHLLFSGRIIALDAAFPEGSPPTLRVRAENALFDLRRIRRTRTFTDMTDSEIFNQLAHEHSLEGTAGFTGPVHKLVAQLNLDDLTFLQLRSREIGATFWIEDGRLRACRREERVGERLDLAYGGKLLSFSASAELTGQVTAAAVTGWHRGDKRFILETAEAEGAGPDLMEAGWSGNRDTQTSPPAESDDAAGRRAKAAARSHAREFVKGRGLAVLSPGLRAGSWVNLSGVGRWFEGRHTVIDVWHRFDLARGWQAEFVTERPEFDGA